MLKIEKSSAWDRDFMELTWADETDTDAITRQGTIRIPLHSIKEVCIAMECLNKNNSITKLELTI